MSAPVYIGDGASASGFRLAGLRVLTPSDDEILAAIEQVRDSTPLILLSATLARQLGDTELERLQSGHEPPLVVIPDVLGRVAMLDLARRMRQQLGVLE